MSIKRTLFNALALMGLVFASFVGVAHAETTLLRPPESAITKIPLDKLDPPRGVAAKDWKSAFCSRWDDGCTHCTQFTKDGPITCTPNAQARICKRHTVLCFGEIDHEFFLRACKFFAVERYWKTPDGRIFVVATTRRVDWISDVNGVSPMDRGLGETSTPGLVMLIADTNFYFLTPQGYTLWTRGGLELNHPAFEADVLGVRCEETYDQK